ncbi:sigma-70 family RNA polymerase sigma factor [Singulisphaera sp. PoT]|uniref:sigma-70 family RNA polymerase sigma factor n=1 Tax=Singulisphaera sp. PoT TaxID=3411797 RepID=UPI003BF5ADC7
METVDPLDHQGFLKLIARQYVGLGLSYDDLIAEGWLGLMAACRKFDPSRNVKFLTFAKYPVVEAIRLALRQQTRMIRLPEYTFVDDDRKSDSVRADVARIRGMVRNDVYGTDAAEDRESAIEVMEDAEFLRTVLSRIPYRDREFLTMYFGLGGKEPMTRIEAGKSLGLTRAASFTFYHDAMSRLRSTARSLMDGRGRPDYEMAMQSGRR